MRNQFTFYASYLEAVESLPPKQQGEVILAIARYAIRQEMPDAMSGVSKAIFLMAKPTLDSGRKKAEQRDRAARNPSVTPTGDDALVDSVQHSDVPTGRKEYKGEREYKREIEVEKEIESEKESSLAKEGARAPRFAPPTVEEVAAYCQERRNGVDPAAFVDFYASKGWKVGNSPMKDWRAAVRTWEKRNDRGPGTADKPRTSNPFLAMALEMEDE